MVDIHTETEHKGWFERIKDAIGGVLFGLVLVLGSFVLLFWNEGRSVRRAKALEEGRNATVSIDSSKTSAARENDLVHVTGKATTEGTVSDPKFGVSGEGIAVVRDVEMYQWEEEKEREQEKKVGGGKKTVTRYKYRKVWADHHISSSSFEKKQGHQNPSGMPIHPDEFVASTVSLGAFELPSGLISKIHVTESIPVDQIDREAFPSGPRGEWAVQGGHFYSGSNSASPNIGDLRVSFKEIPETKVSVIARPVKNTFEPYTAASGSEIFMLKTGIHSKDEMFTAAEQSNTMWTWIGRLGGFLAMALGFLLILNPISVLFDVIPFVGDLVGGGLAVISGVVAFVLSLVTIAIAWISYRPVIGGSLLIVAAGVVIGSIYAGKSGSKGFPHETEGAS